MNLHRLAADENFNGRIVRALFRLYPTLDLVLVRDALPEGTADPEVLIWTASQGRVLLTHDLATMIGFAYQRLDRGLAMPGLVAAPMNLGVGAVVADLAILFEVLSPDEVDGQIIFLPL